MNIFEFFRKKKSSSPNQPNISPDSSGQTDYSVEQSETQNLSVEIQFSADKSPSNQIKEQTGIDLEEDEYVCISTSGDDNVCPMCAQFEGKFFLQSEAPKLPLCPHCSCAYMYYFESDLPQNTVISHKEDFVLPAECVSIFYKHQHSVYEENDVYKKIRLCERDINRLPEFMAPYLSSGFPAPAELVCRDLLPELYMRLGDWKKAEKTIKRCIDAKAYYPNDGSEQLADFESYRDVATQALSYISENPSCLQRSIYKALPYEGNQREQLKHFLRYSYQITKEKTGNTNKLYVNTNTAK